MTRKKTCVGGVHNWGDMGVALDALVMAYARGLERQTITFKCDTCGEKIRLVRVPIPPQESRRAVKR